MTLKARAALMIALAGVMLAQGEKEAAGAAAAGGHYGGGSLVLRRNVTVAAL